MNLPESKPISLKVLFSVWVFLGVAGLIAFLALFDTAFPAASLDLKLSKDEVTEKAVEFADFISYDRSKAVVATSFRSQRKARIFLDYKLGGKKANELMRSEIPVWKWVTRICKPFSPEEAYVYSWPDGRIQGFTHTIAKEKKIPSVSAEDAEKLVFKFAREKTRLSLSNWKLVKKKEEKKANRVDHVFEFEDQSKEFKEARIRANFVVYGNYVGKFREFLHVPEDFTRYYNKIRSQNKLLYTIADSLGLVFQLGALIVLFWAIKAKLIDNKFFAKIYLVSVVVCFLYLINQYWELVFTYDTSEGFFEYVLNNLSMQFLLIIFMGGYFAVLVAAADAFYRKWAPDAMSINNTFSLKGLRAKPTVVGLSLAFLYLGFSLGYQCVFYVVGYKYGVWCPISVRDEAVLGLVFPAFDSMFIGYSASIMEEFVYRVIGIIILTRFFKNVWIANLVQAVLWGFAHSSYPQQPAFIRGTELSIEGFISGAFFIKFGILPSLVAHYLFNVTVSSTPSFFAESIFSKLGALIPYLPPLIWAFYIGREVKKHGVQQLEGSGLQNKDVVITPPPTPKEVTVEFLPSVTRFKPKLLLIIVPLALISCLTGWFLDSQSKKLGAPTNQKLTHSKIIEKSREYLDKAGISIDGYQVATWCYSPIYSKEKQLQYLFEKAGYEKTDQYTKDLVPTIGWIARWYKPLVPQEYSVALKDNGELNYIRIKHHENDKGKALTKIEARQKAKEFLSNYHPELKNLEFSSLKKEVKKNRTDYTVMYEAVDKRVEEAPLKIAIEIIGDKISSFDLDWQVPDKWKLEFKRKGLFRVLFGIYRNYFLVILFVITCGIYADLLTREGISKKFVMITSGVAVVLTLVSNINSWPEVFPYYYTDTPMNSYTVRKVFGGLYSLAFSGFTIGLLSTYCYSACKAMLKDNCKSYFLQFLPKRFSKNSPPDTKSLWMDAALRFICTAMIILPLGFMYIAIKNAFSPSVQFQSKAAYSLFEDYSPALTQIEGALSFTLGFMLVVPVLVYLFKRMIKTFKNYTIWVTACLPMFFASSHYLIDGIITSVYFVVMALAFYFVATRILGKNYLAYFFWIFSIMIWKTVFNFYEYVYPNLSTDMYILIIVGLIPFAVAIDDYFYKPKDKAEIS